MNKKATTAVLLVAWLALLAAHKQWIELPEWWGPPPGERIIVVVHETADRTPAQWQLLDKIIKSPELKAHWVMTLDKDDKGESVEKVIAELKGVFPGVVIGVIEGPTEFKPIFAGPMPGTYEDFLTLVKKMGG
jgi:hypothetical protein